MPQALERADGGWAWVVLLASMMTQGLTLGFPTCIGIFFTELQHEFQASNSETSWFPSILTAMLHAGGFLLDTTNNNFSYVFYMSSFFLISAALFMGGSFCALQKKEKQGRQAEAEAATVEAAPQRALTVEGTDGSEKQPSTEIMYVTSV
ncbi:solute carrier family 16 member 5 [Rhinolophus ferrumequinum]|uniref:Solute carrier family 16 member 5 n=1 Tax=Rhinolophus ferrumequinum TaxID=59479 RepID=A0A7J7TGN3_RHIFE|nr:solute carrier family 16 member 5 [Rhinolophus ferrumequinum]